MDTIVDERDDIEWGWSQFMLFFEPYGLRRQDVIDCFKSMGWHKHTQKLDWTKLKIEQRVTERNMKLSFNKIPEVVLRLWNRMEWGANARPLLCAEGGQADLPKEGEHSGKLWGWYQNGCAWGTRPQCPENPTLGGGLGYEHFRQFIDRATRQVVSQTVLPFTYGNLVLLL